MSNPTHTPLASTAMEAAREITTSPKVRSHDGLSISEDAITLIIQKHFQPLLAKVEAEATKDRIHVLVDELYTAYCDYKSRQQNKDRFRNLVTNFLAVETTALRADLAAKEAENRRLVVAFDPGALVERIRSHLVFQCGCTITGRIIEGMLVDIKRDLGKCVDSALASRADKGGAT